MALRKIEAIGLDDATPPALTPGLDDNGTPEPIIEWGDPADLFVDDAYQRPIGTGGLALIKRVAKGKWNWRKFKLPVITIDGEGRRIAIDGQHTAIMALSRGVRRIPWSVVQMETTALQAASFVGQNKDRTAIGAMQEHVALLAAGDESALTIDQVFARANVKLVMWNKPTWEPGETMALATVRTMINRRYAGGAGRVLRILRAADLAPISADHIKAVEQLLFSEEFKGLIRDEKLTELLRGESGVKVAAEGGMFAATHRVQRWKGLTTVLFRNRNRAA